MEEPIATILQPNVIKRRFAFRVGDHFPKAIRWLYYIVLFGTLIYLLYNIIVWLLKTIQKIGYFCFSPQNYWTVVMCVIILTIGGLLIAEFCSPLQPFTKIYEWLLDMIDDSKQWLIGTIEGG